MLDIIKSLYNVRLLDELSRKDTPIHRIHPLIKLLATVLYLFLIASFGKYEVVGILPFILYPVIIFALAEIPIGQVIKRVLLIEPFIIGIAILNPLLDQHTIIVGGMVISAGWVTFLSIVIKSGLTVTVSILLIATTGMDKLGAALRMLKIPKVFVLQLLLTYRYISVLIEEVSRMQRAYSLRSLEKKGVQFSSWGPFAGQLIIRTFDRSLRVYQSMNLRGFTGEYNTGDIQKLKLSDAWYLLGWSMFFVMMRIYNIPTLIGQIFIGAIN